MDGSGGRGRAQHSARHIADGDALRVPNVTLTPSGAVLLVMPCILWCVWTCGVKLRNVLLLPHLIQPAPTGHISRYIAVSIAAGRLLRPEARYSTILTRPTRDSARCTSRPPAASRPSSTATSSRRSTPRLGTDRKVLAQAERRLPPRRPDRACPL